MHRNKHRLLLTTLAGLLILLALEGSAARAQRAAGDSSVIPPDWIADGTEVGGDYGYVAAPAGDVNGDGFDDVIIGLPKHDDGLLVGGAVYVFHGAPQGLHTSPDWTSGSPNKGDRYGAAAAAAGDVNGDGYDDVIIGAYRYRNTGAEEGRAYLYLGSASGLSPSPAWTYDSGQSGAQLGYAVAGAGDVNADGYDDVVVGARWYTFGEANEGAAYLFFGTPTGLESVPRWIYESDQGNAGLGAAVAGAGDVNGDGFDDVLAGAPNYDTAQVDAGAAFLFYGSTIGLSVEPDWTAYGVQNGETFGAAVEAAGDLNHDGKADIFVGAPLFVTDDGANPAAGAAYVFYGSPAGPSHTANWFITGSQPDAAFGFSGGSAGAAAGDVNGDNYGDLVIGAYRLDDDQPDEGGLFVYLGGPLGLSWDPIWLAFGDKAEATFGFDAHLAGDVNADGYADIIVGAPQFRRSELLYGRAFLFLGRFSPPNLPGTIFLPLAGRDQ